MNSKKLRTDPRFLRNEYPLTPVNGMPIIQLNQQPLPQIEKMLSFHDIRCHDETAKITAYLVHFFKNDKCFDFLYDDKNEKRDMERMKKLAQYSAVCTPDFSVYPEMSITLQKMQIFKSRWCGAHWQDYGLNVVPTITWSDKASYTFCFEGIQQHSTVAVSTVGCRKNKRLFLDGYNRMLEEIEPEMVICYGTPFNEMDGEIICFPYSAFRKKASA